MIYITGDTHRDFSRLFKLEEIEDDMLIILGDAGVNYCLNDEDIRYKEYLKRFKIKLFCIRGNHEERPENINTYKEVEMFGGKVFIEDDYPNLIFAKDGEVYNVGGHNEKPNIFIVKTIINQLHERLKDEGISEALIKHVEDRLGHDRRYAIDPTKIKNDLGWYPETPFEKGIVLTIDWYLEHEEWMEHIVNGNYQSYYDEMYKNRK